MLLTLCGVELCNSTVLKKPSEVPFNNPLTLATAYFQLRERTAMEQFHFNSRTRYSNESIATYVSELHRMEKKKLHQMAQIVPSQFWHKTVTLVMLWKICCGTT